MTDVIYLDLLQTEDGVEHQAADDDFNLSEGELVLHSLHPFTTARVPAAHDGGAASAMRLVAWRGAGSDRHSGRRAVDATSG